MESALGILSSCVTNCGLDLNPNKIDLVLFSRSYKIDTFRELPLFSEVKYLGVVLDSKQN